MPGDNGTSQLDPVGLKPFDPAELTATLFPRGGRHSVDRCNTVVMIPTTKGTEVIKRLEAEAWKMKRIKGSHHQFKHPSKLGLVTVPQPGRQTSVRRCFVANTQFTNLEAFSAFTLCS